MSVSASFVNSIQLLGALTNAVYTERIINARASRLSHDRMQVLKIVPCIRRHSLQKKKFEFSPIILGILFSILKFILLVLKLCRHNLSSPNGARDQKTGHYY